MIRASVIIPNYNGARFIKPLCECLLSQTVPLDSFEVIFVDNGSTDNSLELMREHAKGLPHLKLLTYADTQSSYAARNHGVASSGSDILVFTDADCRPCEDWLSQIVSRFAEAHEPCLVSGQVELFSEGPEFNHFEWYDRCTALDQEKYSATGTGATANLAMHRLVFDKLGGFLPIGSGGDREFCERAAQQGAARFIYAPEAKVLHPARSTGPEVRKKLKRVGIGLADIAHMQRKGASRALYICKQFVGVLIQPNQASLIYRTFNDKGWANAWSWGFAVTAWRLGWYARMSLIRHFLKLQFGGGSGE